MQPIVRKLAGSDFGHRDWLIRCGNFPSIHADSCTRKIPRRPLAPIQSTDKTTHNRKRSAHPVKVTGVRRTCAAHGLSDVRGIRLCAADLYQKPHVQPLVCGTRAQPLFAQPQHAGLSAKSTTHCTVAGGNGGLPGLRVLSRVSPSTPSAMNRSCQRQTTGLALPDCRIISAVPQPSAVARMRRQFLFS